MPVSTRSARVRDANMRTIAVLVTRANSFDIGKLTPDRNVNHNIAGYRIRGIHNFVTTVTRSTNS